MASFNEVDASSYANVSVTVGAELSSWSSSGTNVSITMRAYIYQSTNTYSSNSMCLWLNGTQYYAFNSNSGASHTTKGTKYYTGYQTFTVSTSNASASIGIGVNGNKWAPSSAAGTVYLTLSGLAGTPTINTPSVSSIERTTANSSFSVSNNGGASITDYYIDAALSNFSDVKSTISSSSGTFSGLTPNTTYYVRANASNGYNRGYSAVTSFLTTHNNPSIGSRTINSTRASSSLGSTYTTTISYSTTYDYSSYSSHSLQYGTSTSYGSSATSTGTGGSSSFSISSLQPNKTYYYKITETDATSQSSTATGSFTTPSIAPTLSVGKTAIVGGFKVKGTVSTDTNVSLSSLVCYYGTSTSYGSSYNLTNGTEASITGLNNNTTYYYRVLATDSTGKTAESTGSLKTDGNSPEINSHEVSNITSKSADFSCNVTFDKNASLSKFNIAVSLNGTIVANKDLTTLSGTIDGLKAGKLYTYYLTVTDNYNKAAVVNGTFKTKGGFMYMGKMSDEIKLNGKVVSGIRINGHDIL